MQHKLVASSRNAVHRRASKTNTPHKARKEWQANRLSLSTAAASEDRTQTLSTAAPSLSTARWLTVQRLEPSDNPIIINDDDDDDHADDNNWNIDNENINRYSGVSEIWWLNSLPLRCHYTRWENCACNSVEWQLCWKVCSRNLRCDQTLQIEKKCFVIRYIHFHWWPEWVSE